MLNKAYIIEDLIDQCMIYSILCYKTHTFYTTLKYIFNLPLIISSSIMSILNSNMNDTSHDIKILNITFNIFTALILVINNNLKFEARSDSFKNIHAKFIKLQHEIEKFVISDEIPTQELINSLRDRYDNLVESIGYEIPNHICKNVRDMYKEKKTLPLIINGIKKKAEYRDQSIIDRFQILERSRSLNGSLIGSSLQGLSNYYNNSNIITRNRNSVNSSDLISRKPSISFEKIEENKIELQIEKE